MGRTGAVTFKGNPLTLAGEAVQTRRDESLGMVYDQDTSNLQAQTRGFKGSAKRGQTLGNYQEIRARHLHRRVHDYIDG